MLLAPPLRRRFSLIELLVVMVIIVVLAGLLMAASRAVLTRMRKSKAIAQLAALEAAIKQYQQDWAFYPQTGTGTDDYRNVDTYFILGDPPDGVLDPPPVRSGIQRPDNHRHYDGVPNRPDVITGTGLAFRSGNLVDPWGNPWRYQCPGRKNPQTFDLWSAGPNQLDGKNAPGATYDVDKRANRLTADEDNRYDDIANWKRLN